MKIRDIYPVAGGVSITGQGDNTLSQSAIQFSAPISVASASVSGIGSASAGNVVTAPQSLTQNAQLLDSDSWVFGGNVFS